jgi:hypothetical protein
MRGYVRHTSNKTVAIKTAWKMTCSVLGATPLRIGKNVCVFANIA